METKKIFVLLIMGIFLISLASAELFTIDNSVKYSQDKLKVDIKNTFGLGETIGSVELKSHKTVDEIRKVGYGDYMPVMYYDFSGWDLYSNGLGNVYFTDMRTGEEVDKLYYFAEWKEKTREIPVYSKESELNKNGTIMYTNTNKIDGYKNQTFNTWEKYNSKDIPKTKLETKRIALMVYVDKDDYTDAVWTIAGKRIKEHAKWSASIEADLAMWWTYDGKRGVEQYDEEWSLSYGSSNNRTSQTSSPNNISGIIGSAYNFLRADNEMFRYERTVDLRGHDYCWGGWVKGDCGGDARAVSDAYGVSFYDYGTYMIDESCASLMGGAINCNLGTCVNGVWTHHVSCYDYDNDDFYQYKNGVIQNGGVVSVTWGGPTAVNDKIIIGCRYDSNKCFNGGVDEFFIYNRTLSLAEIQLLYNGSDTDGPLQPKYNLNDPPFVVINSPENYDNLTKSTQTFNTTVTDDFIVQNVSLMQNGTIIETNTSQVNGTYIFTKSDSSGFYNWSIIAYDNNSQMNISDERFYTINIISPTINLYSPENNLITTTASQTFTGDAWDNFGIENVSFYLDSVLDQTNTSGLNYSNYTFSKTLTEGSHTWYFEAYDNDSNPTTSATRTIELDTLSPNITIVTPVDASSTLTNYVSLGETAADLDLNWSVYDPNLDTCWFYNISSGLNETNTCNANQTFKNLEYGNYEFKVYANDTLGFESVNSTTFTFKYDILEYNRTYESSTIQTSTEDFELGLIKDSSVSSVTAKFYYNNNSYTSTRSQSGNSINFTNSIDIPSSINGTVYFYWNIEYENSTGTFDFNTTFSNQTISNLSIAQCATPTTDGLTLNFTTYDSTNLTRLNSTFEANFYFYSIDGTGDETSSFYYSNNSENFSNYLFCLNSGGENVTLSMTASYDATGYDGREYIISNGTIGNFTQNIPLYLTETDLTDIVTFNIQDQSYEPIENAKVVVQRWNIGTDSYSTIGMFTTSSEGQGILDLELYTTWYRAVVYIDGVLTKTTDAQKLSSTTWTITLNLEEENPYTLFSGISADVSFNNVTNVTSYTWVDTSGYTRQGCLVVKNYTSLGYNEIYNSCTTSTSGTIDYLVVGDGSYIAYGYIYLDEYGSYRIMDTESFTLGVPEAIRINSPYGSVISFLAIGTAGVIGVAAGSAILGVFLVIAMIFFLYWIGFLNITIGFIWGIITIGILILFLQRRRGI